MNKADLADKVHDLIGGTKTQSEQVMETIVDTIVDTLKNGGEVSIAGLGIFSTKMRPARMGRNPRTGEAIQVPAMRTAKFRPGKSTQRRS